MPEETLSHLPDFLPTGDPYKDEVQNQWNQDPCGGQHGDDAAPETLDWYKAIERHRYEEYAPWMPAAMEFTEHRGKAVLEIGAGLGTDLVQFALSGAVCTDLDLSAVHLKHAERNFQLRGLSGRFLHGDGETLPFENGEFDVVYSNGVIHHTPNTQKAIQEIYRVTKPGGKVIIMVYAQNSWHFWRNIILSQGFYRRLLCDWSPGEIMSRSVERSSKGQRPLVKVYTRRRLEDMFHSFADISITKRQLVRLELPFLLRWLPLGLTMKLVGWNLVVKAYKPK